MTQFDSIQALLQEMAKRASLRQLCKRIGVSRSALMYWFRTSDSNLSRFRPEFIERIVEFALELGISRDLMPDDAQRLLYLKGRPIFLCHSSGDKESVRRLYTRLRRNGIRPWLDEVDLRPGQDWQVEVERAIRESVAVVVCLSQSSIDKTGFVQKEIKFALDAAEERPEGAIFVIPTRIEKCNVPERLKHLQWIDLFKRGGYDRLIEVLIELLCDS